MSFRSLETRLRKAALRYPEAKEEYPWGDRVMKVRGRIFVFVGVHEKKLHVTTKLPQSRDAALGLPFASPTGYNLGKSGWVSSRFEHGEDVPEALLLEWIDESYRAIAPKGLVKLLDAPPPVPSAPARRTKRPSSSPAKKAKGMRRKRRSQTPP